MLHVIRQSSRRSSMLLGDSRRLLLLLILARCLKERLVSMSRRLDKAFNLVEGTTNNR